MTGSTLARGAFVRAAAAAGTAALVGTPALGQTPATLTVAYPPADDVTPFLVAQKLGLFKKYGVEVDAQAVASGAAATAAVAGGAVQVGLSSLLPLILAHLRGVPVTIVAPDGIYLDSSPYAAMVTRADAPFKTGADLNGKTIGVAALKDTGGMASMAWIAATGGDPSTVKEIEIPYSAQVPALIDGRVDAISLIQPGLGQAMASGKLRVLAKAYSALSKRFLITAWFAQTATVAANRDAIRRFARAILEANAYANAHHDETAPLLADLTKVDLPTIQASTREIYAEKLDAADIQHIIDAAAKYKVIDAGFDARDMISAS